MCFFGMTSMNNLLLMSIYDSMNLRAAIYYFLLKKSEYNILQVAVWEWNNVDISWRCYRPFFLLKLSYRAAKYV